jgi:acyl-CoA thioester hydrolase
MKTHILKYRVPYADVDQMSVVYYANYFVYFERGRNELMRALGLPYKVLEDSGVMLPVIESYCKYFQSAHYDDELEIVTKISDRKGIRIKMECEIFRDGEKLVDGYTWHVTTDLKGKPCRIPTQLIKLFDF